MNEDAYIREKLGTRNVFTVPDGYFDQLAGQVIGRLPADDAAPGTAAVRYLRPLLYAAACVALAIAVGVALHSGTDTAGESLVAGQTEAGTAYSDTYMEEMADYAMLDNEDIYASLLADL